MCFAQGSNLGERGNALLGQLTFGNRANTLDFGQIIRLTCRCGKQWGSGGRAAASCGAAFLASAFGATSLFVFTVGFSALAAGFGAFFEGFAPSVRISSNLNSCQVLTMTFCTL